jgi:hypothetical protein
VCVHEGRLAQEQHQEHRLRTAKAQAHGGGAPTGGRVFVEVERLDPQLRASSSSATS